MGVSAEIVTTMCWVIANRETSSSPASPTLLLECAGRGHQSLVARRGIQRRPIRIESHAAGTFERGTVQDGGRFLRSGAGERQA